jgi:hypothetical protein
LKDHHEFLVKSSTLNYPTYTSLLKVPDHQEVYVDRESDMSLIVELLAYEETVSDDLAAAHYFNDLAQCNEVSDYSKAATV